MNIRGDAAGIRVSLNMPISKIVIICIQQKNRVSIKLMRAFYLIVRNWTLACDPAGTRTQGPYIKSVLLYQLSYGIILHKGEGPPYLGVQK